MGYAFDHFYERDDPPGNCRRDTCVRRNAHDAVPLRSRHAATETAGTNDAADAAVADEL